MVRDASLRDAPHHEDFEHLILRSIATRCVSKDEATRTDCLDCKTYAEKKNSGSA
jgi:hypothetical protein